MFKYLKLILVKNNKYFMSSIVLQKFKLIQLRVKHSIEGVSSYSVIFFFLVFASNILLLVLL